MKGNRPDDAAKLFSAANSIAATALGLDHRHTGAPPTQPIAPPIIHLTVERDAQSDRAREEQSKYAKEHP